MISDAKRFAVSGGMLELRIRNGKTEFVINLSGMEQAKLEAAAPLLELATTIRPNREE